MIRHNNIPPAKGSVRQHHAQARAALASSSTIYRAIFSLTSCILRSYSLFIYCFLSLLAHYILFESTRVAYGRTCIPVRLRFAQFVFFQEKRDSHSLGFSFTFNASASKNLVRSTARLASPAILQVEVYEVKRLTLAAGRVRSKKKNKKPL